MHHHSLGVVDGDVVSLCSLLQSVQRALKQLVVKPLVVYSDPDGAVIHIFPTMHGVREGIIYQHQETKWPHIRSLWHSASQSAG